LEADALCTRQSAGFRIRSPLIFVRPWKIGGHTLLRLLGCTVGGDQVRIDARTSTREDWQREAHRLELQGKHEQADAVRTTILKEPPVPWPVVDEARLRKLTVKVFRDKAPGNKPRQQLYEYATAYDEPVLAAWLVEEAGFAQARGFGPQRDTLGAIFKSSPDGISRGFYRTAIAMVSITVLS
jgi:hypothetical protein